MKNLITVFDEYDYQEMLRTMNDRQLAYCREDMKLYIKDTSGIGERIIDIFGPIWQELRKPIDNRSIMPDYENIYADINHFNPGNSFQSPNNGFVLVTAKGYFGFEIKI